ncbi:response regulator [soil metagenome]
MTNEITIKHTAVMLVDDNDIDNFIHEKVVKNAKFTKNVYKHTSAISALEFLKNIEMLQSESITALIPAYIFLDINMPISDGYYFLEEFEKFSEKIKSKIKIVMLTSSLNPDDFEKSNSYKQVVNYLSKPLSAEALVNMN